MMDSSLPPTYLPGWHQEDLVRKMKYNRLGQTDLMVSQVGFGGCVVGGVYPDKGDLDEIFQVSIFILFKYLKITLFLVCGDWDKSGH